MKRSCVLSVVYASFEDRKLYLFSILFRYPLYVKQNLACFSDIQLLAGSEASNKGIDKQ